MTSGNMLDLEDACARTQWSHFKLCSLSLKGGYPCA